MGRFIAEREKFHSNLLGLHVQQGTWITDGSIRQLTAGAFARSSGLAQAAGPHDEGLRAMTVSLITELQLGRLDGAAERLGEVFRQVYNKPAVIARA